ncbi:hypothetical protein ECE50_007980 [Chitinophaga sp. Mgbs1]|uniref:Uncharacterized protein n=1 Tax=Chitinophaga solisilvae TaxID=1233460 RepID=A0A9Q5GSM7_9BACT|nr:hypothetical protein [Chitinophaga solisilvae]
MKACVNTFIFRHNFTYKAYPVNHFGVEQTAGGGIRIAPAEDDGCLLRWLDMPPGII